MFLAPNGKRYYTVSETATMTGYDPSTIYKWCNERKIDVYRYWIEDKNRYIWGIDTNTVNKIKEGI